MKLFIICFSLLLSFFSIHSYAHKYFVQFIYFPDQLDLGIWDAKGDLGWKSKEIAIPSFGIGSGWRDELVDIVSEWLTGKDEDDREGVPFSLILQQSRGGRDLVLCNAAGTETLPFKLNLNQVGGGILQIFTRTGDEIRITQPEVRKADPGYYLEISIPFSQLISVLAGEWSNSYTFTAITDMGDTKSKEFTIKLTIPHLVKVGFGGDIAVDQMNARGNVRKGRAEVCVYINYGGTFQAYVNTTNWRNDRFNLCMDSDKCIPYKLDLFGDMTGGKAIFFESENRKIAPIIGYRQWFERCNSEAQKFSLRVRVYEEDYDKAQPMAGTYTDTITVTIVPD